MYLRQWKLIFGLLGLFPGISAHAFSGTVGIRIEHPDQLDQDAPIVSSLVSLDLVSYTDASPSEWSQVPSLQAFDAFMEKDKTAGLNIRAMQSAAGTKRWQVDFARWPAGKQLNPSAMDPRWDTLIELGNTYADYYQTYQDSLANPAFRDRGEYLNIWLGGGRDLTNIMLCAGMAVEADVLETITLPPFVRDMLNLRCAERTPSFMADSEILFSKTEPVPSEEEWMIAAGDMLSLPNIRFLSYSTSAFCYPGSWPAEDTEINIKQLIQHQWISADAVNPDLGMIGSSRRINAQCRDFLFKKVLSRIAANFRSFSQDPNRVVSAGNSFLKDLIIASMKMQKDTWLDVAKLREAFRKNLVAIFNVSNGALQSQLVRDDFNLPAVQKAEQAGVSGIHLLAFLFDRSELGATAFYSELQEESELTQKRILRRLVNLVTARCQDQEVAYDCLRASVNDLVMFGNLEMSLHEEAELVLERNLY